MDLDKLDPNVVITLVSLVGTGVAWLYHKAKGDKTESARDILDSIVVQVLNAPGVDLVNVKDRVELEARAALRKLGLKGKIVDTLVHEFAEYALAELTKKYDLFQKQLDQLVKETIKTAESFTAKGEIPKLDITVESIR